MTGGKKNQRPRAKGRWTPELTFDVIQLALCLIQLAGVVWLVCTQL